MKAMAFAALAASNTCLHNQYYWSCYSHRLHTSELAWSGHGLGMTRRECEPVTLLTCSSVASSQPYAMLSRIVPCKHSQLYDDCSFSLMHFATHGRHVRSGMMITFTLYQFT